MQVLEVSSVQISLRLKHLMQINIFWPIKLRPDILRHSSKRTIYAQAYNLLGEFFNFFNEDFFFLSNKHDCNI
jgi:hypothetical protein